MKFLIVFYDFGNLYETLVSFAQTFKYDFVGSWPDVEPPKYFIVPTKLFKVVYIVIVCR